MPEDNLIIEKKKTKPQSFPKQRAVGNMQNEMHCPGRCSFTDADEE